MATTNASEATMRAVADAAAREFEQQTRGLQIDDSGLPSIRERRTKNARPEKPFAREYHETGITPGALPKVVAGMVNEVVNRGANDLDYKPIMRELQRSGARDPEQPGEVIVTIRATREQVPVKVARRDGIWYAHVNGKKLTAEVRDVLLMALDRELNDGQRTAISKEGLRQLGIIAQSNPQRAITQYVSLKTGLPLHEVESEAVLLDGRYGKAWDEAAEFVWLAGHGDFSPGTDWRDFLFEFAQGRPYISVGLLDGARKAYEASARNAILNQLPSAEQPEAPTYRELDALGDDELAANLRGVRKEHARLVRSGLL